MPQYAGDIDWATTRIDSDEEYNAEWRCIKVEMWVMPLARYKRVWRGRRSGPWYRYSTFYVDHNDQIDRALQERETGGLYTRRMLCIEHGHWHLDRAVDEHGALSDNWVFEGDDYV